MSEAPEELQERIRQFFVERRRQNPAVDQPGRVRLLIPIEDGRAGSFSTVRDGYYPEIEPIVVLPFNQLSAKLYRAAIHYPGIAKTAVLAFYEDGSILWLDDHSSDQDFEIFLQRETIPLNNASDLASLVLKTKVDYLWMGYEGRIVSRIDDIPQYTRADCEGMSEDQIKTYLDEQKGKLLDVAPLLYPPSFKTEADVMRLEFFMWGRVFGLLYRISCQFGTKNGFSWSSQEIARTIGKFIILK